jgi:hypothetical protein
MVAAIETPSRHRCAPAPRGSEGPAASRIAAAAARGESWPSASSVDRYLPVRKPFASEVGHDAEVELLRDGDVVLRLAVHEVVVRLHGDRLGDAEARAMRTHSRMRSAE